MAQSLSDEQIQLRGKARRRLVGAIALVVAISAVLPMVLDNKPKPVSQDIAIDIPKQDDSGFAARNAATLAPQGSSVIVPSVPTQEAPKAAVQAPSQALVAAPAAKSVEVVPAKQDKPAEKPADKPAVKPVEKAAEKPAAKPTEKAAEKPAAKVPEKSADKTPAKTEKPQDKKPAADKPAKADKPAEPAKGESFVVQLGAFSNADNAKQLQAKLSANHIKVYSDTLKSAGGDKTRVRAGPYASRTEADKALSKIKQLGLDGKVVPK